MPGSENHDATIPSSAAASRRDELARTHVEPSGAIPRAAVGEPPYPEFAERAFARATGSEPISGNGVRLLLDAGADAKAVDRHGQNAATYAGSNGHAEIAQLLRQRAAKTSERSR